jgi:two-component system alkaline phosphatase synthesis response regulator PhoP
VHKRVLIVEDDSAVVRLLRDNLLYEGFIVEDAGTAESARKKLISFRPDLVLLDLMLPDYDGFEVCRAFKAGRESPLIIVLTARGSQADKIRGLDLGADDYITKPFAFGELLARMRAVMRRRGFIPNALQLGDVVVDFHARRVTRAGRDLNVSLREIEVLRYLAERAGTLVTRDDLLQNVWGYRDPPLTRSVDLLITRLRRKIEVEPHRPKYIRTMHGDGYSLTLSE